MSLDNESLVHITQRIIKTDEVIQILLNSKKESKKISSKYKKLLVKYETKVKELEKFKDDCQQVQNNLYSCLEKNSYWEKHCFDLKSKVEVYEKKIVERDKEHDFLARELKEKCSLVDKLKIQVDDLKNELECLKVETLSRTTSINERRVDQICDSLPNLNENFESVEDLNNTISTLENELKLLKDENLSRENISLPNLIENQSFDTEFLNVDVITKVVERKSSHIRWTDRNLRHILSRIIKIKRKLNRNNRKVSCRWKTSKKFIYNNHELIKKITDCLFDLNKTVNGLFKSNIKRKTSRDVAVCVCEDDFISNEPVEILDIFDEMFDYPKLLSPMSEEANDVKEFVNASIQTMHAKLQEVACQTDNVPIVEIKQKPLVNPFYKNNKIESQTTRIICEKWSEQRCTTKNVTRKKCGGCKNFNFESINFNIKEKYQCNHNESYNYHRCQSQLPLCNHCMHELYCCNSKIRCDSLKKTEDSKPEEIKTNKIDVCDKNPIFVDDLSKKLIESMKSMFVKEFYQNQSVIDFLGNNQSSPKRKNIDNTINNIESKSVTVHEIKSTDPIENEGNSVRKKRKISRDNDESSRGNLVGLFGDLSSSDEEVMESQNSVVQKRKRTNDNQTLIRPILSPIKSPEIRTKLKRPTRVTARNNKTNMLSKINGLSDHKRTIDELKASIVNNSDNLPLVEPTNENKSISEISGPLKENTLVPKTLCDTEKSASIVLNIKKSPEIRTKYKRPTRVVTRQKKNQEIDSIKDQEIEKLSSSDVSLTKEQSFDEPINEVDESGVEAKGISKVNAEEKLDVSIKTSRTRGSKLKVDEIMAKFIKSDFNEMIFNETIEGLSQFSLDIILDMIIDCIIEDSDTQLCCEFTPPAPPLTQTQQKLVTLIGFLHGKNTPDIDFQELVLAGLESNLYASPALWKMAKVARVYVTICKLRRDVERVRCFCVNTLYKIDKMAVPITFVALTCWPEILPINNEQQDNILVEVFVYYLMTIPCPINGYNKLPLRNLLKGYYLYDFNEVTPTQMVDKLMTKFTEKTTNQVLFAVLLFAKNQSTEFVFKNIIKSRLLPQIDKYFKSQTIDNNELVQLENFVDQSLELMIRLCYTVNKFEYQEIVTSLNSCINNYYQSIGEYPERIRNKLEIILKILQ